MDDYFFKGEGVPIYSSKSSSNSKGGQESVKFDLQSSMFSQKNNNSIRGISASFFDQSSIAKNSDSGEFIFFNDAKDDIVISSLAALDSRGKLEQREESMKKINEIKEQIEPSFSSKSISFSDSLQNSRKQEESMFPDYGTKKSNLPPTLKKPKFGFKVHETAASSQIMEQMGLEYQMHIRSGHKNALDKSNNQILESSELGQKQPKQQMLLNHSIVSSIKGPLQQPSLNSSKQISSILSSPELKNLTNFSQAFKQKNNRKNKKVQKASSINSSRSSITSYKKLRPNFHQKSIGNLSRDSSSLRSQPQHVNIAQLKDMRALENRLGKLKHQNEKIVEYIIDKDTEIEQLTQRAQQLKDNDPYAIMKENQLLRAFVNNANQKRKGQTGRDSKMANNEKNLKGTHRSSNFLHSAKSLREISLRKSSQISSLQNLGSAQLIKFKAYPRNLKRQQKKHILANRGMLLTNEYLDMGYSLKNNSLTLYITLKKSCEQLDIKLDGNEIEFEQKIEKVIRKTNQGKQMKFKTAIVGFINKDTGKDQSSFQPSEVIVTLNSEFRERHQSTKFKIPLPITAYNLLEQHEPEVISKTSRKEQIFKTQAFVCCSEAIKDPEGYLLKLFPFGVYQPEEETFYINFRYSQSKVSSEKDTYTFQIRLKQRSFVISGDGNPVDDILLKRAVEAVCELIQKTEQG